MTWKANMTLGELTTEMSNLCAEVERIEARGETVIESEERDSLWNQIMLVTEELERSHGTLTTVFGPDVPAETQRMFFSLHELVHG